ncbi:hypothetical protein [[Flexibacter] sp. ATCC 35208]|uniref:hypothetical protein n=1 Tax=[Flexibacter] sp. ATCC 35208 TaxID=1936242 RepID=UPI00117D1C7A|nr:hypothetical protein [[Flexibacter] sp. ATCC 35208]
MDVVYKGVTYRVEITERIADSIAMNNYPKMYYVSSKDKLITAWHVMFSFRIVLLSAAAVLICCLPFRKLSKMMRKE